MIKIIDDTPHIVNNAQRVCLFSNIRADQEYREIELFRCLGTDRYFLAQTGTHNGDPTGQINRRYRSSAEAIAWADWYIQETLAELAELAKSSPPSPLPPGFRKLQPDLIKNLSQK